MEITADHWKVFELKMQEKRVWATVAEVMGITISEAKRLHRELRADQPELYPCETELGNFKNQNANLHGARLLSIDAVDEREIVRKF